MTAYRSSLFMGVAILALSGAAQAQSPTPAQINFSIPAGSLATALNAYASQAGRQLMFTSDQVAGRRSGGLSGRMTAEAALNQLLAGSGLVAVQSSSGAWVLQRGSRDELAEAVVVDDVVVTGTLLRGPGDTPPRSRSSDATISTGPAAPPLRTPSPHCPRTMPAAARRQRPWSVRIPCRAIRALRPA